MENQFSNIFSELLEKVREHLETRKELLKLRFLDKFSVLMASIATMAFLMLSGLFMLFFIGIGLSLVINDWLDSYFLGYFIVSAIWLLTVILVFVRVIRTGVPLFTNRFIQLLSLVLEVEEEKNSKADDKK